jgi:hypothetical protein
LLIAAPILLVAVGSITYALVSWDSVFYRAALVLLAVPLAACVRFVVLAYAKVHATIEGMKYPCYELQRVEDTDAPGKVASFPRSPLRPPVSMILQPELLAAAEEAATEKESDRECTVLVVRYAERLGNNLLQYAYGLLRAAMLDVAFEASPLPAPYDRLPFTVSRWSWLDWLVIDKQEGGDALAISSPSVFSIGRSRRGRSKSGHVGNGFGRPLVIILTESLTHCDIRRRIHNQAGLPSHALACS